MEVFEQLPQEKKERIINGAMGVFAAHGYHKASASDIAKASGISKTMVFTYFGSKLGCYEYICNEFLRVTLDEFQKTGAELIAERDFFGRLYLSLRYKLTTLQRYPSLLSFSISMYKEQDEKVRPIITSLLSKGYDLRESYLFTDIDTSMFKNPKDFTRVKRMTMWLAYGCAEEWSNGAQSSLEEMMSDYADCLDALKKHFYKEEYTDGDNHNQQTC